MRCVHPSRRAPERRAPQDEDSSSCDEAIQLSGANKKRKLGCFAEPVIGRALVMPGLVSDTTPWLENKNDVDGRDAWRENALRAFR
jgi:hypothetical protein